MYNVVLVVYVMCFICQVRVYEPMTPNVARCEPLSPKRVSRLSSNAPPIIYDSIL